MALQKRVFVNRHGFCAQSGSPGTHFCRRRRWLRPVWFSRSVVLSTGAVGAPTLALEKRAFVDRYCGCAKSGSSETYFCRQGRWVRPPWPCRSVLLSTGAVGAPSLVLQKLIFVDRGGGCAQLDSSEACFCRQGRWVRPAWFPRIVFSSTGTVGAPSREPNARFR